MRSDFLPFSIPTIEDDEINEVVDSLKSGWITTGPKVKRFEEAFKSYVGAPLRGPLEFRHRRPPPRLAGLGSRSDG